MSLGWPHRQSQFRKYSQLSLHIIIYRAILAPMTRFDKENDFYVCLKCILNLWSGVDRIHINCYFSFDCIHFANKSSFRVVIFRRFAFALWVRVCVCECGSFVFSPFPVVASHGLFSDANGVQVHTTEIVPQTFERQNPSDVSIWLSQFDQMLEVVKHCASLHSQYQSAANKRP